MMKNANCLENDGPFENPDVRMLVVASLFAGKSVLRQFSSTFIRWQVYPAWGNRNRMEILACGEVVR